MTLPEKHHKRLRKRLEIVIPVYCSVRVNSNTAKHLEKKNTNKVTQNYIQYALERRGVERRGKERRNVQWERTTCMRNFPGGPCSKKTVTEVLKMLPEAAGRGQHFKPVSQFFSKRTKSDPVNNLFFLLVYLSDYVL